MKTGRIVSLTALILFGLIAIYFFYSIHEYFSVIEKNINEASEIPLFGDIFVVNYDNKIIEEMVITFMEKEYVITGLPGAGSKFEQHIDTSMEGEFNVNVRIKYKDNTKIEKDLAVCIPSFYPHLHLYIRDEDVKVSERIKATERDPNSYGRMGRPGMGKLEN